MCECVCVCEYTCMDTQLLLHGVWLMAVPGDLFQQFPSANLQMFRNHYNREVYGVSE